jgi:tRNA1Val (adenine37-N6)-methyltransferase
MSGVSKILSKSGFFSTIIPFKEESTFISLAEQHRLYLNKICRVKGNKNSDIKRSLLTFSYHKKEINETNLTIENSRHKYTKEYVELTNSFYLKM